MTRRSDLMCEDLFECSHEPETPISDGGEVLYWRCRCGAIKHPPEPENIESTHALIMSAPPKESEEKP